jgi:hypothetical protein
MRVAILASILLFPVGSACSGAGIDGPVIWTKIGPFLEVARDQTWNVKTIPSSRGEKRSFQFTALRFHLGYYQLKLVDVGEFAQTKAEAIAVDQNVDKTLPALFELGVRAVFRVNQSDDKIVAVAPAGFPTSSRSPINLGLLKIDGIEKYKQLSNGPSAVLCLDNPQRATGFQYQNPTYFRVGSQNALTDRCRDEVQIGPRILEDPSRYQLQQFSADNPLAESYNRKLDGKPDTVAIYPGIPDVPSSFVKYLRAAFAIDEPGRVSDQNKDRDVARNAYIVVTTTPAGFWDLQDLFKSPEFYANERYAPRWAVNLPGDDYAALVYSSSLPEGTNNVVEVGAVKLRQASVLSVVLKK